VKNTYKNLKVLAATTSLFLITVLAIGIAAAAPSTATLTASKSNVASVDSAIPITKVTPLPTATPTPNPTPTPPPVVEANVSSVDLAAIKAEVPLTYKEAQASIVTRTRYLVYTSDGVHIMWGTEGNHRFVGTDNNGKQCWGIFGDGIFAGFYDGNFFWGKYTSSSWKAEGLFGLNTARGSYILFPQPSVTASAEP
jgi:hypothetical protein